MKYLWSSNQVNNSLLELWNVLDWWSLLHALIYMAIGFALARAARSMVIKIYQIRGSGRYTNLLGKITYYPILIIFIFSALRALGFDLQVLLGATGILTVAIGFASQTSASNLISGLFLVAERSFSVGDTIAINGVVGEVLAVDPLSVKLRQFDNTMVRIPNEVVIKTQLVNLSRYPTRRFDCILSVSAQCDVALLRKILFDLANNEPLSLQNPFPTLEIKELTDNAMHLQFSVWATQQNYSSMKNRLQEKMLVAFKEYNIAVSNPSTLIEFAESSKPLPIILFNSAKGK